MRRAFTFSFPLFIIFLIGTYCDRGQTTADIIRIEYTTSSRTFRNQVIFTPDSVVSIKEDFRGNEKPILHSVTIKANDWNKLVNSLNNVSIGEISDLKSPTDKRTYDAASHSSIVLTTKDNQRHKHGFDDDDPHQKLAPLMKEIIRVSHHL